MRKRNRSWTLVAALIGAILGAHCSRNTPLAAPKHVLLLVIDTQRADHLGCYGYRRPVSPAIDALAAEGVLFRHAASQASWTLPSMSSMLSSAYVSEEVVRLPEDRPVLSELFQRAGYKTAAFLYNELMTQGNGYARGFDEFQPGLARFGPNDPIVTWWKEHANEKTFTYVQLTEVHDPYDPPPNARRWTGASDNLPPGRIQWFDQISAELKLVERNESQAFIEQQLGRYDDCVRWSDGRIGELFAALRELGAWDDTAIVLTADHGEGLFTQVQFPVGTRRKAMIAGEPATLRNTLLLTHGSHVHRELLHIPLIVKAPGLAPGAREGWVEGVDIAPSLCELCGIALPTSMQGHSLIGYARDGAARENLAEGVFSFARFNTSVITQASMQVVLPTARGECDFGVPVQVYDLARDPDQRVNLVAKEGELVARARALVARRMHAGLTEAQVAPTGAAHGRTMDPELLEHLQKLGYLGTGVVDSVREELTAMRTEELIAQVADTRNCLLRLEALFALRERSLEPAQRRALEPMGKDDISPAIRAEIEKLLER